MFVGMATASYGFTPEECERLFRIDKTVITKIRWKAITQAVLIFDAKVISADGTGLDLHGHYTNNGRFGETRWGFSLTYRKHCVRQYDMAHKHHNHGTGWIRGPHKHKYSSSRIPRFAYKPNPPISDVEPNQSLLDFLAEANIQIPASFQYFIFP
jgi:hypothetical protein